MKDKTVARERSCGGEELTGKGHRRNFKSDGLFQNLIVVVVYCSTFLLKVIKIMTEAGKLCFR